MPYWKRESLLRASLERYEALYPDIEVIIVNDGDEPPMVDDYSFVRVINLLEKTWPGNPCVPWNVGVAAAKHETIVLTHAEIRHEKPVFEEMLAELKERGPKGYVLASCWGEGRWYCYPGYRGPKADRIPDGAGLNFCAMMNKSFFNEIGGFDEIYRDGAGYEDNDFIWAVHKNGGNIVIRGDLIVNHFRTYVNWGGGRFEKNKRRFHDKWSDYWNQL